MGFVHETESEIFNIETRSESAYLGFRNDADIFIAGFQSPDAIRKVIAQELMNKAGTAYAASDESSAKQFKAMADEVLQTAVRQNGSPCIEATYEWIAELVHFCNTNEVMQKNLEPFLTKRQS